MREYRDFFDNLVDDIEEEFYKVSSIEYYPNRNFKFTCYLGYEYEIMLTDIQLLNYPIKIDNVFINDLDERVPSYLVGVKYDMRLISNGCVLSEYDIFSSLNDLNYNLNNSFERLFGNLYFHHEFVKNTRGIKWDYY